jgi:triacylglycerol lipase
MIPRKVRAGPGPSGSCESEPAEDLASCPVLLVPGWGAPLWHTRWIAKHLGRQGLTVEQMSLPFMSTGDMVGSAEAVDALVDEILARTGAARVNMVGYSLGGLIARIWLQGFDGHEKLGRAAFVGSPQDGIYTGYAAAFTKAGRQVSKGSRFMRELNREGTCACGDLRCLSIFLWKDGTILPARSARLSCGYNMELVWPVMHWGLVFNRQVIAAVADFLKGGLPYGAVPGGGCVDAP